MEQIQTLKTEFQQHVANTNLSGVVDLEMFSALEDNEDIKHLFTPDFAGTVLKGKLLLLRNRFREIRASFQIRHSTNNIQQYLPRKGYDKPETLQYMMEHYSGSVILAMQNNDRNLMKKLYKKSDLRFASTTAIGVVQQVPGFNMGDYFKNYSTIRIGFENLRPKLAKKIVKGDERDRMEALSTTFVHPYLVSYQIVHIRADLVLIMDYYPVTLQDFNGDLELADADKIVLHIMQALEYIHSFGYAHCDVKPDNICISTEGIPILIDIGSVCVFETCPISTTEQYVPSMMVQKSSALLDFWMLMITVLKKSGVSHHCALSKSDARTAFYDAKNMLRDSHTMQTLVAKLDWELPVTEEPQSGQANNVV